MRGPPPRPPKAMLEETLESAAHVNVCNSASLPPPRLLFPSYLFPCALLPVFHPVSLYLFDRGHGDGYGH